MSGDEREAREGEGEGDGRTVLDRIILAGMIFYGFHGAREPEKQLGQRFIIDLEMALDLRGAGESDDLGRTVSYSEVYRVVREIVEGPSLDLLEAVAERIAAAVLAAFGPVLAVEVTVKKPEVPIHGVLDYAAVRITRRRAGP
jgi:dihydroneopterin aldolase